MRHKMAKFVVFESVLNEYVNHPTMALVAEIEADTEKEAVDLARLMHPNKATLVINGNKYEA